MLSQEGGCEHAILKRIQTGWLKFRELSGLLIGKGMSLRSKGIIYTTCIQQQQQQPFILIRLFFLVYWGQPRLWPSHNIFLHLDLSQSSSLQSPFFLISSFNTSLHLFLGLPFTLSSSTCSVSILFIQHNSSLLSTWPNHLNLFCHITSPMS